MKPNPERGQTWPRLRGPYLPTPLGPGSTYAHSDKLTGQCEFALYEASVRLERAVAGLTYIAKECDDDIDQMCANVAVGEGRVLACLEANAKKLSKTCERALNDVGLMK